MSDGSTNHRRTAQINGHEYEVGYYPGFASRITLDGTDLYHQATHGPRPYHLPAGASRPLSSHALELNCASKGFALGLHIDDPQHVVESIVVKLRDPAPQGHFDARRGGDAGGVVAYQSGGSTLTVENTALLCPPYCSGPG
jgi:hypothetical protein